jgi:hypothetical protein
VLRGFFGNIELEKIPSTKSACFGLGKFGSYMRISCQFYASYNDILDSDPELSIPIPEVNHIFNNILCTLKFSPTAQFPEAFRQSHEKRHGT